MTTYEHVSSSRLENGGSWSLATGGLCKGKGSDLDLASGEVKIPTTHTELSWSHPTLLNGDSIASCLFPKEIGLGPQQQQSLTSLSPFQYQPRVKRPQLPILQVAKYSAGKVTCSPKPGLSLRLDELLTEGYDPPSLVFKVTVQPLNCTLILKLHTEQEDKMPSHLHLTEDQYYAVNWGKENFGKNAQMQLSCEADRFKDLAPLQGSYVPWSYGFYEVSYMKAVKRFERLYAVKSQ